MAGRKTGREKKREVEGGGSAGCAGGWEVARRSSLRSLRRGCARCEVVPRPRKEELEGSEVRVLQERWKSEGGSKKAASVLREARQAPLPSLCQHV
jgi:hypothetical protein